MSYTVPAPCLDLYGLVADDPDQERDDRAPVERVRERAALIDGLIARGIIDAWWDPEREGEWLWCRSVPAPWLLLRYNARVWTKWLTYRFV